MKDETEDQELLRRYAETHDEGAFGELVRRHVNLVYGCARRRVGGDAHLAEDVTQQVFCDVARQARTLARHGVLAGWLHTSTRFAAAHVVRAEQRRRERERAAFTMNATAGDNEGAATDWDRLRPVLDETIDALEARDREAVVLRFFEGRSFGEIGARLRLTENAARMRVERALDKLHALLRRRGIGSTAAALGVALASHASVVAPAGLAGTVTTAAVATTAGAAVGGFMSMITWQMGLAGAAAIAGVSGVVLENNTVAELRTEVAALREQTVVASSLEAENLRLGRLAAEVGELRRDDAELARLETEAGVLRNRLQQIARAEEERAAAMRAKQVYELRALDQTPRPRFQARPQYPFELRRAGITGEVVVDFVVSEAGDVVEAKALRSTQKEFEAAAVEAVSKWKFAAGQKGGRDVATHLQVPVVFTLEGSEARSSGDGAAGTGQESGRGAKLRQEASDRQAAVERAMARQNERKAGRETVNLEPFVAQAKAP